MHEADFNIHTDPTEINKDTFLYAKCWQTKKRQLSISFWTLQILLLLFYFKKLYLFFEIAQFLLDLSILNSHMKWLNSPFSKHLHYEWRFHWLNQ